MPLEKQFSIFVENKVGSLSELCNAFSKAEIDIRAISIIDDLEWGIVKCVVDDQDKAKEILHNLGLMYGESQVLTVELENHPGALGAIADSLSKKKINIEQAYATATGDTSFLVMSTTDDNKASKVLGK